MLFFRCSQVNYLFVTSYKKRSVDYNIPADIKLINELINETNVFNVVIYEISVVYFVCVLFVNNPAFPCSECRVFVLFLVLWRYAALNFHSFVLPSSSKVTLTFPPWSLLFPPQFPCISCNPVLHRFYDFCIGGLEEQRYARPRAAYLSNANRLDSSKSHWNCIMHSSLVKYLPSE